MGKFNNKGLMKPNDPRYNLVTFQITGIRRKKPTKVDIELAREALMGLLEEDKKAKIVAKK